MSFLIFEESSGDSSQVHGRFVDPLDNPSESLEKFNQLVSIDDKGKIEWLTQDDRAKTEAWKILPSFFHKQLTSVERGEQQSTSVKTIESFHEREVIRMNGNRVILSGVAGTGKSTLYHQIKEKDQSDCVMKIALIDGHFKNADQMDAVDFVLSLIADKERVGPFLHSLIRHRLTTGDRVFLFFDGYDEIGGDSRTIFMNLVKKLNESVRIYITTRSHAADKLQFQMCQLAYTLKPLNPNDQIGFLVKNWCQNAAISKIDPSILERFATTLTVEQTLGFFFNCNQN